MFQFLGRRNTPAAPPEVVAATTRVRPLEIPVNIDTAAARAQLADLRSDMGETIALSDVLNERLSRLGLDRGPR